MNVRIITLVALLLTSAVSVSALGIIGAIGDNPTTYETYILENALEATEAYYGSDVVSSVIKDLDDVTEDDLRENIVILIRNGRVVISVPEGSTASQYLSYIEPYLGDYLPTIVRSADEVIDEGIDDSFGDGCVESDSGIYESGFASGRREGSSVVASYEDLCVGSQLVEYSCANDLVVREEHDCANGCSDGACIDYAQQASSSGGGDGKSCSTRWIWTRSGFVCETPDVPVEIQEAEIEPPETCSGCVSGERCMPYGGRLPNGETCTGLGLECLGCVDGDECLKEGETTDDRVCEDGELVSTSDETEPVVDEPSEPIADQPVAEPTEPEELERKGLFARIGAFFARLFGRG